MSEFDLSGMDVFASKTASQPSNGILLLDCDSVFPDPKNVRKIFDAQEIAEMANSIRERGQLQPIVVEPQPDGRYMVCFGERRWRACQSLGMKVRAVLIETADQEGRRIDQFIENDQRANLSTSEIVAFVGEQLAEGRKVADLARMIGRERTLVSRYASLVHAPEYIAKRFDNVPMRALTILMQAHKIDPDQSQSWVESRADDKITVAACSDFHRALAEKGRVETSDVTTPVATPNAKSPVDVPQADVSRNEIGSIVLVGSRQAKILSITVMFMDDNSEAEVLFDNGKFLPFNQKAN